jgi:hypothetical protein
MSDDIRIAVTALVPGEDGKGKHVCGTFVMVGNWEPFDTRDYPIRDTVPDHIDRLEFSSTDGTAIGLFQQHLKTARWKE